MKKPNFKEILKVVKIFFAGVVLTLVIMAMFWVNKHYRALATAISYPEVVESLKIEKQFNVKK